MSDSIDLERQLCLEMFGDSPDTKVLHTRVTKLVEFKTRLLDEAAEREPPKVCGNCKHGEPTAIDSMRCYHSTPYIPTGIRCKACVDWEPCFTRDNPRLAVRGKE